VDPEFTDVLAVFPPLQFTDPAAQRRAHAELRSQFPPAPRPDGVSEERPTVPAGASHEVPVRVYRSDDAGPRAGTIIWIHGGGFCIGTPDEDEAHCLRLAADLSVVVVSVDYRLAPEHPFPAGFDDCYAVLLDVAARQGDTYPRGALVVAGASAGAGLAAAVALRARDEGGPRIRGQVLVTPFLDAALGTPSMRALADAPVFDAEHARTCWDHYLGARRSAPPAYASPSAATDMADLPSAYVLAAGADCLRDEAIDYAVRLQDAGVPTELHVIPGVPHGFTGLLPTATASRRARRDLNEVLAQMLADEEETT